MHDNATVKMKGLMIVLSQVQYNTQAVCIHITDFSVEHRRYSFCQNAAKDCKLSGHFYAIMSNINNLVLLQILIKSFT